jgi:hypothetical protein
MFYLFHAFIIGLDRWTRTTVMLAPKASATNQTRQNPDLLVCKLSIFYIPTSHPSLKFVITIIQHILSNSSSHRAGWQSSLVIA